MSIEKDQSRQININTNILKFPNQKENLQLEKQRMDNEKINTDHCNEDGAQ